MASTTPGVSRLSSAAGVSQRRHRHTTTPLDTAPVYFKDLCKSPSISSAAFPCLLPTAPLPSPVPTTSKDRGKTPANHTSVFVPRRQEPAPTSSSLYETARTVSDSDTDGDEVATSGGKTKKPHQADSLLWRRIRDSGDIGPGSFRTVKQLGEGSIGRVILAELRGTGGMFALKVMNKRELELKRRIGRAETEREILRQLDHPFLPTLYSCFETDNHSCLVMDYCRGGDLNRLRQLQDGGRFSENAARFYAAEVVLALEYLHMLGIVYRDLKPENVLTREDGHIMLSDFDLSLIGRVSPTIIKASHTDTSSSKGSGDCVLFSCFSTGFLRNRFKKDTNVSCRANNQVTPLPELVAEPTQTRSRSFVGTCEYMAPEIIRGNEHGSAVDWWTLGIFLYELLFGRTPFKGINSRNTMCNVISDSIEFPESPSISYAAKCLISSLLVKEPEGRLASRRGATEVKQHQFFQKLNWALIRDTIPPEVVNPIKICPPQGSRGSGNLHTKNVKSPKHL